MASPQPESVTIASDPRDRALRSIFRLYKATLSPVLQVISPSRCLYLPTCSEYAYTAMSRFGIVRGSWLALGRIARCHPWGKGGLDPVPERNLATTHSVHFVSNQKDADHLP